MYQRILVPFDGSETSHQALASALQLAHASGGRVRIVHAFDELVFLTGYEYSAQAHKGALESAREMLDQATQTAAKSGVPVDSKLIETPGVRLGDLVADEARAWDADLVVVGTHGRRGIGRVLLGSGAEQVIRGAPVPVLAVRAPAHHAKG